MKIIAIQPAIPRFQWELEVLLTNLKQFGEHEVVLLFSEHDNTVPKYLADKYGVQCLVYKDERPDGRYIPSLRPYLWWKYLSEDPSREQEQYLYIDSDIIFREMPHFATLGANADTWVGSHCVGYVDYAYVVGCRNGEQIVAKMAEICGITVEQMKGVPGIGAQLLITNPTADWWFRVYKDCLALYDYFTTLDSDLQKWTIDMWAHLWGMVRAGKTIKTHSEMDFCMATDPIERWDQVKIMHNAGVTDSKEMFFKGNYVDRKPFGEDFSYVRSDKVSRKYVEALQKVVL